jgi:Lysophospholipase L1 and related esterases
MKNHGGAIGSRRMATPVERVLRGSAALAGSALGVVVGVGVVTVAEGILARGRLMPKRDGSAPPRTGLFGAGNEGDALQLAMIGDSLAVGYGADDPDRTPGVLLANGLASASGRPVVLHNVAEVGAESTRLAAQIAALRRTVPNPDVAVIVVGANDIMHLRRLVDAVQPLSQAVRELRAAGTQVVVATCPDLGTVRPFFQPLRFFAHWLSRLLATSQTIVVLRAGGRTVSLGDTLGPLFRHEPLMFSTVDHLHPSGLGYEHAAGVLLPSVRAAAGYPTPTDAKVPHRVYRKGSRHPLAWWAFRASRRIGVQLRAAEG